MNCRHCGRGLSLQLVDLGAAPPSNVFHSDPNEPETAYRLRVLVCTNCWLVQTDTASFPLAYDEVFKHDYPYYSSTSPAFVEHARRYVQMISRRLELGPDSLAIEIGSNDGYLLQWFGTPCIGIEPTRTAQVAVKKGIRVLTGFFTTEFAKYLVTSNLKADLVIANNVLAHVPDINDFLAGVSLTLKPSGIATFEFPSLSSLVRGMQFDTIYAEHYSYLSLTTVTRICDSVGLSVFDVDLLPTHGGSYRVYVDKFDVDGNQRIRTQTVNAVLDQEFRAGVMGADFYHPEFQFEVNRIKDEFLSFLLQAKRRGAKVAAFGAAAKGNTLLNYAGVKQDLLPYVVDDTPAKQGRFLPGSRIPVLPEFVNDPDYIVILPWNFREEIMHKLSGVGARGRRFVTAIPGLEFL